MSYFLRSLVGMPGVSRVPDWFPCLASLWVHGSVDTYKLLTDITFHSRWSIQSTTIFLALSLAPHLRGLLAQNL